ncbi:hypothetical protein LCGC14_0141650 [marine sediment metagenome]|uniref:Uncharacterized protein n=1 Tax=marine sediment metagenome TaxID=412755 RepID=A0A0F9V120_9ZZZZ
MAAAITFYAGQGGGTWVNQNASGLGFFGTTFGTSVQVGQYQDTSYITTGNGSAEGPQATNNKFITSSGISVDGDVTVAPSAVAVNSGTMNIRFTFDSAVKTQNCQLRIFDRTTINNGATGVTTQVVQYANGGSGVTSSGTAEAAASHTGWIAPSGSGVTMALLSSAGTSGLSPSGTDTIDTRHDWYIGLSCTPLSIGSKELFGLYTQLEYL